MEGWLGGESTCYSCKAPRSLPNTHTVAQNHHNPSSRDFNMYSVLGGHCIHVVCIYTCRKYIHICKIDKSLKKFKIVRGNRQPNYKGRNTSAVANEIPLAPRKRPCTFSPPGGCLEDASMQYRLCPTCWPTLGVTVCLHSRLNSHLMFSFAL